MSNKIFVLIIIIFNLNNLYSNEVYVLQDGDTLYSLSKKYKTSLEDIITLNNINDITSLSVGTSIEIPTITSHPVSEDDFYLVQKGDTLFSISNKFDLSLSNIMEYNNLKEDDIISLGQKLIINSDVVEEIIPKVATTIKDEFVAEVANNITPVEVVNDSVPYWPINGDISKYSGRIQGVKIEGTSGDYIKAVTTGKVIWYDSFKGIGKVVLIEGDNGYDYLYGSKEDLNVHMGVQIKAGERLGRLKEDNNSIIFSVFKNGKPLNNISEAPR